MTAAAGSAPTSTDIRAYAFSGEKVIIDGLCASACTIVLGALPHDRICVTSHASLGFHAAWDFGNHSRVVTNPNATQMLYWLYPLAGATLDRDARRAKIPDALFAREGAVEYVPALLSRRPGFFIALIWIFISVTLIRVLGRRGRQVCPALAEVAISLLSRRRPGAS
jgi:hypothetical protein